uniref:Metallophosphoesterase 1 homolog n=1 Tax=Cacopsylla melanoneura TaxID=428564 RepID=A0A8D8LNZ7_9HEMI
MRIRYKQFLHLLIVKLCLFLLGVFVLCEHFIYYIVLWQCDWPTSPHSANNIKAMFIADTHLLGPFRGHWFDKLRREWQMYKTFQTSVSLHQPEHVFVLGDLLDEGQFVGGDEFERYVSRFYSLFATPEGTELHVVPGNHDMGFHYRLHPYLNERFSKSFNSSVVKLLSIKGSHFVLINSMALEGDGCFLCKPALDRINLISAQLKCTKKDKECPQSLKLGSYSQPIILQHFPLYRISDKECSGPDSASDVEKSKIFRQHWECISKESTDMILDSLSPRLVIDGHTHNGCHKYHAYAQVHEYTVPSFSWRNKNNPSFLLAVISPDYFSISKCYMPEETTVLLIYTTSILLVIIYSVYQIKSRPFKRKYSWSK